MTPRWSYRGCDRLPPDPWLDEVYVEESLTPVREIGPGCPCHCHVCGTEGPTERGRCSYCRELAELWNAKAGG